MRLLFCKNQSTARFLLQPGRLDAEFSDRGEARVFTHDGIQNSFTTSPKQPSHILTPLPPRIAASALIHHSLLLFKSGWSKSFVEHVADSVIESGCIHIPAPKSGKIPLLGEEDLVGLLGKPLSSRRIDGRDYLCFHAPVKARTPSTLRWSIDYQDELKSDEMDRAELIRRFDTDPRPAFLDVLLAEGSRIQPPDPTLHAPVDAARAGELFSYFHAAVAPKIALVRQLANSLDIDRELHHVDIGGGMGNLGAELIIDDDCRVATSLNVEFDAARLIMGRSLLDMYESELAGNWVFQPAFAQDHGFHDRADLITSFSALLYVPRSELVACLDRAWDSLNPGGMLAIYEHIKHPRFVRDHDWMFEKDELETLMRRFGDFSCISGSSLAPMANDAVAEKSVYRVLRKSS
jgi:trans-aconitate methyltransferase